ncbi:hypothetical protein [Streptomyces sp. Amel2xE9]|uniref:hypothetical protein n=1 Tax=unclassified Streptomyces TaxID=2593676 RepID=UPI000370FA7E|nr:hypothetical protein [Streptomyces sp. Amel2xE9]
MEGTSVAEEPAGPAPAGAVSAGTAADDDAGSDPEAAETGDGAAAPEAAADAGGDGVDIPKQQSAEEAAEQETGKGART